MRRLLFISFLFSIMVSCQNNKGPQIQKITADQMLEAIEFESIQLIDVRTPAEYREGSLKKAHNICITNEDFRIQAQMLDINKPVYLFCKSGGRSAKAAEVLKEMGFKQIYDLSGGMDNWNEKEFDTEKS
jgi:rhodanese-related sulfurtransferase